jgi:site-specific recombinase XerD
VESFFREHLQRVRGASPHTLRAYRDALRLFFSFLADAERRGVADLRLDDLRAERVLAFLTHLESRRGNGPTTRNCRLAAIRAFFGHLLRHDPTRAEQYHRVLALPSKRTRPRPPTYLEPEEIGVLLGKPDASTPVGTRDHALLLLLYNTGARVSEALSVRISDLQLSPPRQVRLHGKGGKDRLCPLWRETAVVLGRLLGGGPGEGLVFRNARGQALSPDGVAYLLDKYVRRCVPDIPTLAQRRVTPHVLRHSCAVALLQAGIDVTVIRDYLGHASVATTSRYITANLAMKRKVLEAFWRRAGLASPRSRPWRPKHDVLAFLESL